MAEVAVLGLGNLGSAVAGTLVSAGRQVVVWNRTAAKSERLRGQGAEGATTVADAIDAAPVVISVVLDYETLTALLVDRPDLHGRTLVNLSWGSPDEARRLEEEVTARGGRYVDGGVLCRPQDIGGPMGDVLYAGEPETLAAVRPLLDHLGPVHIVGTAIDQANAVALALGAMFYTGVLSFLEAAAYAQRMGIDADRIGPLARIPLLLAAATAEASGEQIVAGEFAADQASNSVHAAALAEVEAAFAAAGTEHQLVSAVRSYFGAASRAGLDGHEVSALIQVVSGPDALGSS